MKPLLLFDFMNIHPDASTKKYNWKVLIIDKDGYKVPKAKDAPGAMIKEKTVSIIQEIN